MGRGSLRICCEEETMDKKKEKKRLFKVIIALAKAKGATDEELQLALEDFDKIGVVDTESRSNRLFIDNATPALIWMEVKNGKTIMHCFEFSWGDTEVVDFEV